MQTKANSGDLEQQKTVYHTNQSFYQCFFLFSLSLYLLYLPPSDCTRVPVSAVL